MRVRRSDLGARLLAMKDSPAACSTLGMDVRRIYPAHGPVIADGPAKVREYIARRLMRERRVRDALTSTPKPAAELCAVAYADTPPFLWPLAERSLLAHLVKLVEEGAAVDDGSGYRLP